MRRPAPSALLASLALLAILGPLAPARADDTADEADLHFRLGAEAYQRQDYPTALVHFHASNRLAPNHNVLFNIARTYEILGDFPAAFRYYDLSLEGETVPPRGRTSRPRSRGSPAR
jgi:tetratricopeptide (TPR) repeat protein